MSFRYVTIYHGPCDSFHTVAHKPQKLRGIRDRLQKLGYRVGLVPVDFINYCMLEMCGHEVFRCNIQNLHFNTTYNRDKVCQRAVEACRQASVKLQRARRYFWFRTLIEEQASFRNTFGPKDYWPKDIPEPTPFATCLDCVACCGILTQKKTE